MNSTSNLLYTINIFDIVDYLSGSDVLIIANYVADVLNNAALVSELSLFLSYCFLNSDIKVLLTTSLSTAKFNLMRHAQR